MNFDKKKILAVDYGTKYTGLAQFHVGQDPFVLLFGRLKYSSDEALAASILAIIEEDFFDLVVLGIPYFTDGTSSKMTETVRVFKDILAKKIEIPVVEQDETLSSYEAEDKMKNDPKFNFQVDLTQIDAVAASIILEDFLRTNGVLKF